MLKHLVKWLKKNRIAHQRMAFLPGVTNGHPDFEIYLPGGRALMLELKAPKKEPTKLQYKRLRELAGLGFPTAWFDNSAGAIAWIRRHWYG